MNAAEQTTSIAIASKIAAILMAIAPRDIQQNTVSNKAAPRKSDVKSTRRLSLCIMITGEHNVHHYALIFTGFKLFQRDMLNITAANTVRLDMAKRPLQISICLSKLKG